jgi:hypothetical protein
VRGCACRGTAGFAHVSCLAEQAKILFADSFVVRNRQQADFRKSLITGLNWPGGASTPFTCMVVCVGLINGGY